MCGVCHTAKYCTDLCQRGHWSEHKPACETLGAARDRTVASLAFAAEEGDLATATKLLETGNVNKALADGRTALIMAVKCGQVALVKVLLEAGADANKALNNGATLLQTAAQCGHPAVVKVLIEAGADANKALNTGCTPLHVPWLRSVTTQQW
jgi:ankyrin repeat protein